MHDDWPAWEANPPPRIAALHSTLSADIPCTPDTAEVRQELVSKRIGDLIMIYLSWRQRLVPARPRKVEFADGFWTPLAQTLRREVEAAVQLVEAGGDLKPFLSEKIYQEGFAPARFKRSGRRVSPNWGDKDFALNSQGVHHVHLARLAGARSGPSDDLLFTRMRRHSARFIAVGNHKSFEDEKLLTATRLDSIGTGGREIRGVKGLRVDYSTEDQLKLARRGINTIATVGGEFVIGEPLALSGDRISMRRSADLALEVLRHVEENLHERSYARRLYNDAGGIGEPRDNWRWGFADCDLILEEFSDPSDVKRLTVIAAEL